MYNTWRSHYNIGSPKMGGWHLLGIVWYSCRCVAMGHVLSADVRVHMWSYVYSQQKKLHTSLFLSLSLSPEVDICP